MVQLQCIWKSLCSNFLLIKVIWDVGWDPLCSLLIPSSYLMKYRVRKLLLLTRIDAIILILVLWRIFFSDSLIFAVSFFQKYLIVSSYLRRSHLDESTIWEIQRWNAHMMRFPIPRIQSVGFRGKKFAFSNFTAVSIAHTKLT